MLVDLERQVGRERVLEEVGAEGVVAISNLLDDPEAFRTRAEELSPENAAATFAQFTNIFEETVTSSLERLTAAWEQFVDNAVDALALVTVSAFEDPVGTVAGVGGLAPLTPFLPFIAMANLVRGGNGEDDGLFGSIGRGLGNIYDDISGLFGNEQENLETSLSGYSGAIREATDDIQSATSEMNAAIRRATTLTRQVRRQAEVLNTSVSLGYQVT